jgi:hypothetical protein
MIIVLTGNLKKGINQGLSLDSVSLPTEEK